MMSKSTAALFGSVLWGCVRDIDVTPTPMFAQCTYHKLTSTKTIRTYMAAETRATYAKAQPSGVDIDDFFNFHD